MDDLSSPVVKNAARAAHVLGLGATVAAHALAGGFVRAAPRVLVLRALDADVAVLAPAAVPH